MATTEIRASIGVSLKKAQIFSGLSEAEINSLAARAVRKIYDSGEQLFTEGDPCEGFYIITRGNVRIFKSSPGGREQVLAIEGPGSSIAELPVFDGGDYPASSMAATDAEVIFISRKDFHAFCLDHPEVALKVLKVVGSRLRRLVGIIEELSFTTVRNRLVAFLLQTAKSEGRKSAQGVHISLSISHQEIAARLGTVRELVSRNLTRLQAEGLLSVDGREILIKDIRALGELQTAAE